MTGREIIPISLPSGRVDKAIWHPVAPSIVFENAKEYLEWYEKVFCVDVGIDVKTAPTIGLILQKSHINMKDDTHYVYSYTS